MSRVLSNILIEANLLPYADQQLWKAISEKNVDAALKAIQYGADVNRVHCILSFESSVFEMACYNQLERVAMQIIESGLDLSYKSGRTGRTIKEIITSFIENDAVKGRLIAAIDAKM
jgi:predicted amino acid dehydrogenase